MLHVEYKRREFIFFISYFSLSLFKKTRFNFVVSWNLDINRFLTLNAALSSYTKSNEIDRDTYYTDGSLKIHKHLKLFFECGFFCVKVIFMNKDIFFRFGKKKSVHIFVDRGC